MGYAVVGFWAGACVGFALGSILVGLLISGRTAELSAQLEACVPWRPDRVR